MRTSNLTEQEISGIKIITQGQRQLAQVKRAITQTIVAKKRGEVRDDLREAGDRARDRLGGYAEAPNFHLHGNSDDDQADTISESESNCSEQWCELDGQEQEALISLSDARNKLQHATKIETILPKRWRPCKEHRKIHRRVEESNVVQSMWCHRRMLTACQKPQEEIPSAKGKGKSRRFRREKSDVKGRGGSSNYPIVEVYNDGSKN